MPAKNAIFGLAKDEPLGMTALLRYGVWETGQLTRRGVVQGWWAEDAASHVSGNSEPGEAWGWLGECGTLLLAFLGSAIALF
jgi:hypothetical protein